MPCNNYELAICKFRNGGGGWGGEMAGGEVSTIPTIICLSLSGTYAKTYSMHD